MLKNFSRNSLVTLCAFLAFFSYAVYKLYLFISLEVFSTLLLALLYFVISYGFLFQIKAKKDDVSFMALVIPIFHLSLPCFLIEGGTSYISSLMLGVLIVLGTSISCLSALELSKSFGVFPALRIVKTSGPYNIVRHPIYSGYILWTVSWLLYNFNLVNLFLNLFFIGLTFIRINLEERVLKNDDEYLIYCSNVKYKVIPCLF